MIARLALLLTGLFLLAGCGTTAAPAAPGEGQPDTSTAPLSIAIPKLDASSTLIPVGLRDDGQMDVPPLTTPMQAAWYEHSAAPGAIGGIPDTQGQRIGAAIIIGHIDGHGRPGIFHKLATLKAGDTFTTSADDGTEQVWTVTAVQTVPKERFPTQQIYGPVDRPTVRLVTCGGRIGGDGHYDSNVIVNAEQKGTP